MNTVRQRIACKALVCCGSKILILREAGYADGTNIGKHQLSGGRLEPGEPFMDGLRRELREETGLEVVVDRPLYVGEWFPVIRGERNQIVGIFFQCTTETAEVRLSEEHDDYRWIMPEEYGAYDFMGSEREVIQAYLAQQAK